MTCLRMCCAVFQVALCLCRVRIFLNIIWAVSSHHSYASSFHMSSSKWVSDCVCVSVVLNPPGWEVCLFVFGFLVLFAVVIVNLWKLYKSGSFPTPSPYPNFHYRYLQEKYGSSHSEIRQKVIKPLFCN